MQAVLIIEDEDDQADLLAFSLRKSGYTTSRAATGVDGITRARKEQPDFIILDVRLPDIDGFEVCRRILQDIDVPIMLLSACRNSEEDRVLGLSLGAVDYLAKSHSHKELLLRIDQVCKNKNQAAINRRGGDCLKIVDDRIYRHGSPMKLPRLELLFLLRLLRSFPLPVSYSELSFELWGGAPVDREKLKVHASRLRAKLGNSSCCQCRIKSVHCVGYRLAINTKSLEKEGFGIAKACPCG